MNAVTLRPVALMTAVALVASGCTQLSSEENTGVFAGAGGAAAASAITRGASLSTAEAAATGVSGGAIVTATVTVIAKHQATVRQRQVAEARARAAYARLLARQREAERSEEQRRAASAATPKRKAKTASRKPVVPRYIAVDTEKDERTAPTAKKAVMIWDTQSQEIVGNNVYDVESAPSVGATARFETYSAEYVGAGS